ncbi:hypothetical protein Tco_0699568 [Tanacetum coccineum]
MSKVLQEKGFGSLPNSTKANLRDQVKSILTTIEADSCPIRRIGSSQYAVYTGQNCTPMYETRQTMISFPSHLNGYCCEEKKGSYVPQFSQAYSEASHINNSIPKKEKTQGLTVELADMTVKYPKGIAENILVGIGKFVFPVDFIILDMPEDIKVPLILGRPFLSTTHAKIDVYKRNITLRVEEERIVFTSVKLASSLIKRVYMLSLRERMELDLEARLIGETLVLNRSLDHHCDYIELNNLNKLFELRRNQGDDLMPIIEEGEFHNSIMKDKMVYKGNNVIGALMNVPIFLGTFSVVTDFAVLEDMDAYRDEGMDDVSEEDKKNGISHTYQKLKGFYKGVLNLGPDYIRDAKMEEWLTRGHISVQKMK